MTIGSSKTLGLVGLVGSAFFGGAIIPSLVRVGTQLAHPFIFNWFRAFLGLMIVMLTFRQHWSVKNLLSRQNLSLIISLGLGLGLNMTLFSFAINYTTLIASQLIYVLVPVATSLLAVILLKEKVNQQKVIGILTAMLGILILIVFSKSPAERSSLGSFFGNSLIFIGVWGYSSYLIFSKKYNLSKSVVEMLILTSLSLTILFTPLAIGAQFFTTGGLIFSWKFIGVSLAVAIASLGFTGLVQLTVKHLSASTASLSSLLSPEFAAITGVFLYQESISAILLLSLVLAISGVIISTHSESKQAFKKLASSH